jgi:hypothetical protein
MRPQSPVPVVAGSLGTRQEIAQEMSNSSCWAMSLNKIRIIQLDLDSGKQ